MVGSLNVGGSQTMVMNLYRNIDRSKIQFDFIIDRPNELFFADEINSLGGNVYVLPTFSPKDYFKMVNEWKKFLLSHNYYSAVHFHVRSYISLIIPIVKSFKVPVISHSHSISSGSGFSSIVKSSLQFPIRYQADYFLACSDEAGKWLFGEKILNKNNYHTVKNAIDGNLFYFNLDKRSEVRKKLQISEHTFVFGNVGRLTAAKNHMFLLEVFSELRKKIDSKLLLIGDGQLKNDLLRRAEFLGIKQDCIFLGDQKDVFEFYNAMDTFIFPSLWEGLGIAVIEAETNGIQCYVSDRVPDSVDINAGLVKFLSLNEPSEYWAEQIINKKICNRKSPVEKFKSSGYDIDSTAKWYESFYLNIR